MDEAASQKEAVEQQLNEVLNAQVISVNKENIDYVQLTDIFCYYPQDGKSSVDDAAVLKQELVSVQKMMDDVTREKVNKSTLFCCVFTCGRAGLYVGLVSS